MEHPASTRPDASFQPETLLGKLVLVATCGRGKAQEKAPDRKRVRFPAHNSGVPAAATSRGPQGDAAAVSCICETPSPERFSRGHGVTRGVLLPGR